MSAQQWRALVWLLLWGSWLAALQSRVLAGQWFGPFVPELGLVLLLGVCARLDQAPCCAAALLLGCARAGVSIEPASAVLAGYLAIALLLTTLKRWVDVEDVFFRGLCAGALALVFASWLQWVEARHLGAALELGAELAPVAWRGALASAIAALLGAAWLARLPGLKPLTQSWRSAP